MESSQLNSSASTTNYFVPGPPIIRNPTYIRLFDFEKSIDQNAWALWHWENIHLAPLASVIYLITIFTIRKLMVNRTAFNLRRILFLWNTGLALFSLFGFLRSHVEIQYVLSKKDGFYETICRRDQRNAATSFWGLLFTLSKILELGDTIFIVLRKQSLIFLHYYHHVSVLCYTWLTAHSLNSTCVWFGVMNYAVHTLMYSYYSFKAVEIKVPKTVAMIITMAQIMQMVMGIWINLYVIYAQEIGRPCATERNHVYYALVMYASYFFLFGQFFYKAYFKSSRKKHQNITVSSSNSEIETLKLKSQ